MMTAHNFNPNISNNKFYKVTFLQLLLKCLYIVDIFYLIIDNFPWSGRGFWLIQT